MKKSTVAIAMLLCFSAEASAQRPMFVVNGVRTANCAQPGTNPLAEIDASTIENVEVIKGPTAIKLYGAEATNGVVSVTVRKGVVVSPCGATKPTTPAVPDPIASFLYPPELVMSHQDAIGLTDRQRTAILDAVKELQSKVADVQMKLAASGEKLSHTLAAVSIDESSVLQQIDQVLAFEREVKRAQVTLMVRVKNQLTAAQQATLDKMR